MRIFGREWGRDILGMMLRSMITIMIMGIERYGKGLMVTGSITGVTEAKGGVETKRKPYAAAHVVVVDASGSNI